MQLLIPANWEIAGGHFQLVDLRPWSLSIGSDWATAWHPSGVMNVRVRAGEVPSLVWNRADACFPPVNALADLRVIRRQPRRGPIQSAPRHKT